jgi:hypothetical protein
VRHLAPLLLAGLLCACSRSKPLPDTQESSPDERHYAPATGVAGCLLYSEPKETGTVPSELHGLSGLAASVRHPGVFWAHNDSDQAFRVYAIEDSGKLRATLTLTGATPGDLEDIAVGPCGPGPGGGSCFYLADTGDNFQRREQVRLYRVPEPEQLADATLPVEALAFTFPDGPRDAEALIIDARTGRLAVITRTLDSLGEVYALDGLSPHQVTRATRLGTLRAPGDLDRLTTAAALHGSGERLLLRTYTRVWEVRRPQAQRLEELIQGEVAEVPGASQAQAEAIAFTAEQRGYLLGSEFTGQPLYRTGCR